MCLRFQRHDKVTNSNKVEKLNYTKGVTIKGVKEGC